MKIRVEMSNQFLRIVPRFIVNDLELALSFYSKLGFQTTYNDGNFAMIKRNNVDLHINYSHDIITKPSHSVYWGVEVSGIKDLYQKCWMLLYLPKTYVQKIETKEWGFK